MKGMENHLYMVYHKVDDNVLALPCVGDQELMLHGKLVEDMGIQIMRIMDLEYDLEVFMTRIFYDGLQQGWWKENAEQ